MITIQNMGTPLIPSSPDERIYEIRINRDLITIFSFNRSDGLAKCLLAASQAVEKINKLPKELIPNTEGK